MSLRPKALNERKILQLAILGDARVGKTALLRRYKDLPFEFTYSMTIGADFVIKRFSNFNGYDLTLQVYDVGGQPKFHELRSKYYSTAEGVIIVFDLMRRKTFDSIPKWLTEVLENNDYRLLPLLLLGNKEDLAKPSVVDQESINEYVIMLQEWGKEYDPNFTVTYNETSAKSGYNVKDSINSLVNRVMSDTTSTNSE